MYRRPRSCIYYLLVTLFSICILIIHNRLYAQYQYHSFSRAALLIKNTVRRNNSNAFNVSFKFIMEKGYWDFKLNSFLYMEVLADITPDINHFLRANEEYLKLVHNKQVTLGDQVQRWGSMSSVAVKRRNSIPEDPLLTFSRLWYSKKICKQACNPDRSYQYVEAFDSHYRRVIYNMSSDGKHAFQTPSIVKINQSEVNACCLGPEDARIVLNDHNEILFTFNMIDIDNRRKIWQYNLSTNYQTYFSISRNETLRDTEKNWTPFIKNNQLYFIYTYNPLQILKCSTNHGDCEFISVNKNRQTIGSLRGGTQLVKFMDTDYFVGIARSTVSCNQCKRFYRPHVVVISTKAEQFHLVYISEPLMLDNIPIFASYSTLNNNNSGDFCKGIVRIMTPGSIVDWNIRKDRLTFTLSVNDKRSFVVSAIGIGNIVQSLIFAVENNYNQILSDDTLGLQMVSNSETSALDYCKFVSDMRELKYPTLAPYEKYPTTKTYKDVIVSPTYPKFRVATIHHGKVLETWISNDYVNFGLIGRYLTEYELALAMSREGTTTSSVMIDVGGNHGTYALYGATLNQSVHVFEILPDYRTVIKESIRLNETIGEKIILHDCGIGDQRGIWKVLPQEGGTRLDFLPNNILKDGFYRNTNGFSSKVAKYNFLVIPVYPLDDFVFQKVSVMKIDVEGFEIRVLKGANRAIDVFGVGAVLIEIASNRWTWNNITIDEGILVLDHVCSTGNYSSYVIARSEYSCPVSEISKIKGLVPAENVFMMSMQNGRIEPAPQIYKINDWGSIMNLMKINDWSCNFWLEKEFWTWI